MSKIHFISIGGAAMHNLAIALKNYGHEVTGSDDEIYEPSRTNLLNAGLLPKQMGWDTRNIHSELDFVILGMHAKKDNPELAEAQKLGLKIYSYPEFIYEQSQNKQRIVIAGSHGKTTITSMILHVLKKLNRKFDYLVGAKIEGFDLMVSISDAPIIVIEGDEYLSSPIDLRSKFLHYKPHILLVSGIAWDHINVFKTFDSYINTFKELLKTQDKAGTLIFDETDQILNQVCQILPEDVKAKPYRSLDYSIVNGQTILNEKQAQGKAIALFGEHNMKNLSGAKLVLNEIGVSDHVFFETISDFKGASKRLEKMAEKTDAIVFRDFAHAPSKVLATTKAAKELYPNRKLVAFLELHTFSSLNEDFLPLYKNALDAADLGIIYYDNHTLAMKNMPELNPEKVRQFFGNEDLRVFNSPQLLHDFIKNQYVSGSNLLLMSSGTFGGFDWRSLN